MSGYRPVSTPGRARTDLHCHECNKVFIAELDFSIAGNHVIECAHCGHEHCRTIEGGVITGERWATRLQRVEVERRHTWASEVVQASTRTPSQFIRDAWMNLSDRGL